jgi:hypothetical protein
VVGTANAPEHGIEPAGEALDLTPLEAELGRSLLQSDWTARLLSVWPSWGLCPRHAVGFALVEIELRHEPFSVSIMYVHLLESAARGAAGRFRSWRGIRSYLTARAACVVCERLAAGDLAGRSNLAEQINRRREIHRRLDEARPAWRVRACPLCITGGAGIVCRPHLLAGARQDGLAFELTALSERLRRFVGSMCAQKTETDLLDRLSWLETIGWFGGWNYPQKLMLEREAGDEG